MMKLLFAVFWFGLSVASATAQVNIAQVFRQMPNEHLRILTTNDRMDLLDFAENKMTARVTNRLDAATTLDTLTSDYLHLTLTPVSTLEMKLLPMNDSLQVVAMVHTVAGPSKDSSIRFFTADWKKELPASTIISYPSMKDYLVKNESEMNEDECQLIRSMEPALIEVTLEPETTAFTFRRSIGVLPKEKQPQAEGLLRAVRIMPRITSLTD